MVNCSVLLSLLALFVVSAPYLLLLLQHGYFRDSCQILVVSDLSILVQQM